MPVDVYYKIMPMGIEEIDTNAPWTEQHVVLIANSTLPASWSTSIVNETLVEPDESFQWRITRIDAHGRQVTPGSNAPVYTIQNDDKLKIVVDDLAQPEGTDPNVDTNFVVNLHAENKVEGGVNVTLQTRGYTASDVEGDYNFTEDSFTFTETGPQSFTMTVAVRAGYAREANEKFNVAVTQVQSIVGFAVALYTDDQMGWGLITIQNDDEGTYTNTGGGKIAFYNSAADGVVMGDMLKWQAEHDYPGRAFDVASPAALNAALTAWVAANGRVDEIAIYEHGNSTGQWMGDFRISGPNTQVWAPLSNDGLHIRFFGCEVGLVPGDSGNAYCDWVCDDAAPAATVTASKTCVTWTSTWVNGVLTNVVYVGDFTDFNGFQKRT